MQFVVQNSFSQPPAELVPLPGGNPGSATKYCVGLMRCSYLLGPHICTAHNVWSQIPSFTKILSKVLKYDSLDPVTCLKYEHSRGSKICQNHARNIFGTILAISCPLKVSDHAYHMLTLYRKVLASIWYLICENCLKIGFRNEQRVILYVHVHHGNLAT